MPDHDDWTVPIGAEVVREGTDVTITAFYYGWPFEAADALAEHIFAEVIDLFNPPIG